MSDTVELTLEYGLGQETDPEELDQATFRMYRALMDQDFVNSVKRPTGEMQPGAKGDPITLGALAVTVIPGLLPKLADFVLEWLKVRPGHSVKFKGTISGQPVEYEGTVADLQALMKLVNGAQSPSPSS